MGSLLSKNTGAKFIHVPYRGVAPALTDLHQASVKVPTSVTRRRNRLAVAAATR